MFSHFFSDNWIFFLFPLLVCGCLSVHDIRILIVSLMVLFVVVPDLLDHLRATFNPSSNSRLDKRFDEVKKAPLLVLDDLGTESATAWDQPASEAVRGSRW